MEIVMYPADWLRARMWALRGNFTGQGATYIALAEMLGNVPLLTADARIRDAPVKLNCPVEVL
jgi:predicted nucleic acid-binding protein